MKKSNLFRSFFSLIAIVIVMLTSGSIQECKAQWWKDTVWTKNTNLTGYYMLKFSKNDAVIVAHNAPTGPENPNDVFIDAATGNEITRISGNNEIFFFNNNRNFVRLRQDNSVFEIFDANTYQIIDTIENDDLHINQYPVIDMSKDERYLIAGIPSGFRIWDVQTRRIFQTKIYPDEPNLKSVGINNPRFICGTNQVMVQLFKQYTEHNYGDFVVYDINTLDSVDSFGNHRGFVLSNSCKYIAYGTGEMYNGVEVYDFNTKTLLWKIPINGPSLTGLKFSPDDKYLVTSSSNSTYGMTIWDMKTGEEFYHYETSATYRNMDVSNNGKFIVFSIASTVAMFKSHFDGVSVEDPNTPIQILYPNPTNNTINLSFELSIPAQLKYSIFNETGQIVKTLLDEFTNPGTINKSFDVSDIPNGTFYLKITGEITSIIYKVIILR